jgi:hypothetical protein
MSQNGSNAALHWALMTIRSVIRTSYVLGVLGYGLGMVLSMLGQTPAGLLLLATTAVAALALLRSQP